VSCGFATAVRQQRDSVPRRSGARANPALATW